ncbi:hypothetical protein SAMN02799630_05171 [Paenibacillus sp. UNCCL117]|uniref:anti-sigma factor family protein n=1 Tax=unclassified Paenibacillus TaxID=185978 RepID=UPI0008896981|nr:MULTISPECIES: hypothetical protein [unclassified Paenibacillus]SDE32749.1 hypothetical protein SAMN04488602_12516 [Paenibacillus sp. cl123]SFW63859.1 hypothetical protein SAMN02799630_05171 [Paenibacillus sp. UNCCL117]
MTHVQEEVWLHYASDRLTPEERQLCEVHLEQCDECLELYMHALDKQSGDIPEPDMERLTQAALSRWDEYTGADPAGSTARCGSSPDRDERRSWMRHPVFHYTVAASITLMLMGSGVFQVFTQQASAWGDIGSQLEKQQRPPSWSEQLMERTTGWLAAIRPKANEAERRGQRDE